jgi:hypothetical protein
VASPKSTRQGAPSSPTTMFAGQMLRCITPRRCIPATARANPSPSSTSCARERLLRQLRHPGHTPEPLQHLQLVVQPAIRVRSP